MVLPVTIYFSIDNNSTDFRSKIKYPSVFSKSENERRSLYKELETNLKTIQFFYHVANIELILELLQLFYIKMFDGISRKERQTFASLGALYIQIHPCSCH